MDQRSTSLVCMLTIIAIIGEMLCGAELFKFALLRSCQSYQQGAWVGKGTPDVGAVASRR